MMPKAACIYFLNDDRGKVRYVGKTVNPSRRLSDHLRTARNGGRTHRDCWVRSLLAQGFSPTMEVADTVDERSWGDVEKEYIRVFRAIGIDLVNVSDGGDCGPVMRGPENRNFGRRMSESTKAKLRASHRNFVFTPEHRAKISKAGKGRRFTPEHRQKISKALKGKVRSEEHSLNISRAKKGVQHPKDLCIRRGLAISAALARRRAEKLRSMSLSNSPTTTTA